jgi:hypothetical protein
LALGQFKQRLAKIQKAKGLNSKQTEKIEELGSDSYFALLNKREVITALRT